MGYGMNSSQGLRGPAGNRDAGNLAGNFREKRPHGYQKGTLQQFTPEQMQLFKQLFGLAGPESYLSKLAGGSEEGFAEYEEPFRREFQTQQAQLGSRFSQLAPGAMSAQRGSGFSNAANQQSSDFAMQLAGRRKDLQRQAVLDLMGLGNDLLGKKPFEQFYIPKNRSNDAEAWGKIGGFIPGAVSAFTGGGSVGDALKGALSIFGGGSNASSYDMAARTNPSFLGY